MEKWTPEEDEVVSKMAARVVRKEVTVYWACKFLTSEGGPLTYRTWDAVRTRLRMHRIGLKHAGDRDIHW